MDSREVVDWFETVEFWAVLATLSVAIIAARIAAKAKRVSEKALGIASETLSIQKTQAVAEGLAIEVPRDELDFLRHVERGTVTWSQHLVRNSVNQMVYSFSVSGNTLDKENSDNDWLFAAEKNVRQKQMIEGGTVDHRQMSLTSLGWGVVRRNTETPTTNRRLDFVRKR